MPRPRQCASFRPRPSTQARHQLLYGKWVRSCAALSWGDGVSAAEAPGLPLPRTCRRGWHLFPKNGKPLLWVLSPQSGESLHLLRISSPAIGPPAILRNPFVATSPFPNNKTSYLLRPAPPLPIDQTRHLLRSAPFQTIKYDMPLPPSPRNSRITTAMRQVGGN